MSRQADRIDAVYAILSGDDRLGRACAPIPDSLCTNLPLNYVLIIAAGFGFNALKIETEDLRIALLLFIGAATGTFALSLVLLPEAAGRPENQ